MEEWRDIPGYEGLYQVSNQGRVKSVEKIVYRKRMGCYIKKEFIMKPTKHKGYKNVILSKNGISKRYKVHRLVAEVFLDCNNFKFTDNDIGIVFSKKNLEVNHKDENKENNCVENLEWCTHSYNMKYGSWKIRRENNFDRSFCCRKVIQYDLEGNFVKTWDNIAMAQQTLNISHISDCCNNKRKTAGGYVWKHAK